MDNTKIWIDFIKMCNSHGVDLDFITSAVYEYCVGGWAEDGWTFTRKELDDFINGIVSIRDMIE